jgi:hypothetical protein
MAQTNTTASFSAGKINEHIESHGHQQAENIKKSAGEKKLENIAADTQRDQQVATERISWTTYKQNKLKRQLHEFETETDVQQIGHGKNTIRKC